VRRPTGPSAADPRVLFEEVFESGGELFLAVGYTPGGAPFGPRVKIVDGELQFPDELPLDVDAELEAEAAFATGWKQRR
jgi:hypothetical protein